MPIIKSAQKRMRQEAKRRAHNRITKDQLKQSLRNVEATVNAKESGKAAEVQSAAYSQIDRAVKKNLLHKNTAARKKSQISARMKSAFGDKAVAKPTKKTTAKKAPPKKTASKTTKKKPAAKKTPAKASKK